MVLAPYLSPIDSGPSGYPSPRVPYAHQPSCAADVAPSRYAPSAGLSTRFHSQPGHQAISCLMPFHGRPTSLSCCPGLAGRYVAVSRDVRLGRTGELHPRAPSVAAPALLEACGFSVCSVEDWRSSACRTGGPAWPLGQCVCSWRSAQNTRPAGQLLWAERRSMRTQTIFIVCTLVSSLV